MSVLSDLQIIKERTNGNIVIETFDRKNLGNCSYDITLGENFYHYDYSNLPPILNPFDSDNISSFWELSSAIKQKGYDKPSIIINPGETILGHTQEFIGGKNNITTIMKARSSMGRSCVNICKDAGWGDVGYINRWTLEIQNTGPIPVILPVGSRIGQIVFLYTGETSRSYSDGGNYQESDDIEEIMTNWSPQTMLPKGKM